MKFIITSHIEFEAETREEAEAQTKMLYADIHHCVRHVVGKHANVSMLLMFGEQVIRSIIMETKSSNTC